VRMGFKARPIGDGGGKTSQGRRAPTDRLQAMLEKKDLAIWKFLSDRDLPLPDGEKCVKPYDDATVGALGTSSTTDTRLNI
jgi:hypothetical protein